MGPSKRPINTQLAISPIEVDVAGMHAKNPSLINYIYIYIYIYIYVLHGLKVADVVLHS